MISGKNVLIMMASVTTGYTAKAAIEAIKAETGAASVKDMGKVMAVLKERHGSVIDMSKASGLVKAALS